MSGLQYYAHNERSLKRLPKLGIALNAVNKLKAEIKKCRVKITIGKNLDE